MVMNSLLLACVKEEKPETIVARVKFLLKFPGTVPNELDSSGNNALV